MLDIFVRYLHFIAIFVMFALLTVQHVFLKKEIEPHWLRKLAIFDLFYGLSALIAMACGFSLWLWLGKAATFYSQNGIFHTKITLFFVAAALSIIPTRFILKNRRNTTLTSVPKYVTMIVRCELLLLCIIPLLATLMAAGIGIN